MACAGERLWYVLAPLLVRIAMWSGCCRTPDTGRVELVDGIGLKANVAALENSKDPPPTNAASSAGLRVADVAGSESDLMGWFLVVSMKIALLLILVSEPGARCCRFSPIGISCFSRSLLRSFASLHCHIIFFMRRIISYNLVKCLRRNVRLTYQGIAVRLLSE